jgi:hypothetical protein
LETEDGFQVYCKAWNDVAEKFSKIEKEKSYLFIGGVLKNSTYGIEVNFNNPAVFTEIQDINIVVKLVLLSSFLIFRYIPINTIDRNMVKINVKGKVITISSLDEIIVDNKKVMKK